MENKKLLVECKTADEVNQMEEKDYRYDGYSDTRDIYIMIRRKK